MLIGKSPLSLREELLKLYRSGLKPGSRTGWKTVDVHYTVVPGQLTVVTGWPGSGKSEWVDALALNLARQGWRFFVFSPENMPLEIHLQKIIEKYLARPFRQGPTERMTEEDAMEAAGDIDQWFEFGKTLPMDKGESGQATLEDILEAAEQSFAVRKVHGADFDAGHICRGLIIDPWNELEHLRPRDMSETEYISQALSKVRNWARAMRCHVWIIAHPQKLYRDRETGKLPIPKPDSISGSQNWWNKADCALTVHREQGDFASQDVEIHVWKVRFKHVGSPGVVPLKWDRITGRYLEPESVVRVVRGGRDD